MLTSVIETSNKFAPSFRTPPKKSSKASPILQNISGMYKNSTLSSVGNQHKFLNKNLTSLPLGTIAGKQIYKCSDCSKSPVGVVRAYAINSNQGSVRPYNEDRVVAYNTTVKSQTGSDVQFTFIAVYDGHGGQSCANYLSKELHFLLADDSTLLSNPLAALK